MFILTRNHSTPSAAEVSWARRCVGCWVGQARASSSASVASACVSQTVTPRARSVWPQPGCCMAGCPALWEQEHDWDVCLEQNKVALSGSSAWVSFVWGRGAVGNLRLLHTWAGQFYLNWFIISLWTQEEGERGPQHWRDQARKAVLLHSHPPCSCFCQEVGCQGDTKRPRRAGALLLEKEFNFLKATRMVGC